MSKSYASLWTEVEHLLKNAHKTATPEFSTLAETASRALEEMAIPPEAIQIPQWEMFNSLTGGLRPHEFSIISGPTGSGKTTWLANLSAELLVGGIKHFAASVETGPVDYCIRVIGALDGKDYNTGEAVSAEEIERLKRSYGHILRSNGMLLARYENKVDPRRMLCDLYYAAKFESCKVAILDNLNFFMPIVESREALTNMDRVLHDFVILNKALGLHTIMVMHPRKTDNGRLESEHDLKGSSTAAQEASNIFLMNRPSDDDVECGFDRETYRDLKFAKLRRRGMNSGRRIMYKSNGALYTEAKTL